ncbi:alanyl-trna synthetase [Pyrenophora seminiperda CCB06]|uniref:Alanyl-trna synthetase n=1 Tax=Pyrenophora seminiperda CCB06 TaxID=1302712 RepID=A0A3M7LY21_9PLEO|nr:alanyl-trna synthetase [Pyrenophora seminiperda CCB06]
MSEKPPADPLAHRTIPLYQTKGQLYQHKTTLLSVQPLSSLPEETRALFKPPTTQAQDGIAPAGESLPEPHVLSVSETIFHAQGGGQPSDLGTMTTTDDDNDDTKGATVFTVHQVRSLPTGAILHMGLFPLLLLHPLPLLLLPRPPTSTKPSPSPSASSTRGSTPPATTITDSKASHYPSAAHVLFTGAIPSTLVPTIQATVDDLVAQDLAVNIAFWDEDRARRECLGVEEGMELKGDEVMGVRVVDMGGKGSYPCGGTHVERLGEVGKVVVKGVKRSKGVSRISYDVV